MVRNTSLIGLSARMDVTVAPLLVRSEDRWMKSQHCGQAKADPFPRLTKSYLVFPSLPVEKRIDI